MCSQDEADILTNRRFQSLQLCWNQSDMAKTFISTKYASLYVYFHSPTKNPPQEVHCRAYVTMVMQEVNQLCKTENPTLTLKLLCHSQILLHSPGPSFCSPGGSALAACGLEEEIIIDTPNKRFCTLLCCFMSTPSLFVCFFYFQSEV